MKKINRKECPQQWFTRGIFPPQPAHSLQCSWIIVAADWGTTCCVQCVQTRTSGSFVLTLANEHPELDLICFAKTEKRYSSSTQCPAAIKTPCNAILYQFFAFF